METARIINISTDETEVVAKKALTIPEQARAVKVVDSETYSQAGEILVTIKGLRKEIGAAFDPIIKKAHEAHKEAKAQKDKAEAPLIEAENIIKPALAAYDREQERLRREEEERQREIARKAEEERRLREAEQAEKEGRNEEAQAIIEEPVYVPPVVLEKTTPKVQGISMQKVWKFRVTNEALIPREYMTPDMVKIGGVARATKGSIQIPGVEIYSEDIVKAGAR
ncbi:MAG: hypothetical protein A4E61_00558 [Syntrophorhabdus sp. PtaB.Bin184]|nr:MAG: hypothetical protein A4E61_00558 [Syntrophorhabdus sp. PtaB.Bin184]